MAFPQGQWRWGTQGPLIDGDHRQYLNVIPTPYAVRETPKVQSNSPASALRQKNTIINDHLNVPHQHRQESSGGSYNPQYQTNQHQGSQNQTNQKQRSQYQRNQNQMSQYQMNPQPGRQNGGTQTVSRSPNQNHPDMLLKHEFQAGMIINANHFEEDRNQGESRGVSNHRTRTSLGFVHHKTRYMIVAKLYHTHYVCVPLYTHEGNGLQGKEQYAQEFMSVRHGRIRKSDFNNQSVGRELVTDGTGPRLDPLSVAWLTHTVSRDYGLNVAKCGSLDADSLTRLLQQLSQV